MFTNPLPKDPLALELLRRALLSFLDAERAQIKRIRDLITLRLSILATITDRDTFREAKACGDIQRLAEYALEIGYLATDPAVQRATCVPDEARTYIDFEKLHNDRTLRAARDQFARANIALRERGSPLLPRLIPDSGQILASDNDVEEFISLEKDEAESMLAVVNLAEDVILGAVRLLYACCEAQLSELRQQAATVPSTSAADALIKIRSKQLPFGLTIDENRRTVTRGNRTAKFEGHNLPWCIFLCLVFRYDGYYETNKLLTAAWEDAGAGFCNDPRNLRVHIVTVRELLSPLGLTVKYKKKIGYRLEELVKTARKLNSTRSRKRPRTGR
jgi:hypothetical protein